MNIPQHLNPDRLEENLNPCGIIADVFVSCRLRGAVLAQDPLVNVRTILATAIQMEDADLGWSALRDSHAHARSRFIG